MVSAWNETGVIGNMAELAATTLYYENYHIFVGTCPSDPDAQRDVDEVCARFPDVHKVVCARVWSHQQSRLSGQRAGRTITQFERRQFRFCWFYSA